MRGRGILALAAAGAMVLSGCGWMDGHYVSVTPHQVILNETGDEDARRVGSYTELRGALIGLIDSGSTKGLFSLAEYPRENVLADMDRAVAYVTETYPIGAYAVESIDYAFGTGLGASAMSVDITYRQGRERIEGIRTVRWISGAEAAIADALDECAELLVLQVSGYQDRDFSAVVREYAQLNPDRVMELPDVCVEIYPDRGDTRVVELRFSYQTDREELRSMREQVQPVFSSAALYVSGQAGERVKFSQLYTFLTERFDPYTLEPSVTPSYSLLCRGVGDSRAFAEAYAAMCSRIGLKAQSVCGQRNGEAWCWNLINIEDRWYHLDLLSDGGFQTWSDEEMTGYDWDRNAYPTAQSPAG